MHPIPVPQPESDFYWEKLREEQLWLRRCEACTVTYFYPRDICPHCFSRRTTWWQSSGKGTLYSFAIVHRPPTPDWKNSVPYVIAIVELEGGARIPTNLVNVEPDPSAIHVGMAVTVVFRPVSPTITLPLFEPTPST